MYYIIILRNVEKGWFRLNRLECKRNRILFFDFIVFKWKLQVKGEGGILKDFALIVFFYRHKAYYTCPKGTTSHLYLQPAPATYFIWKRASQQAQFGLLSESKPAERVLRHRTYRELYLTSLRRNPNPLRGKDPYGEIPNHKFQIPNKLVPYGHI